MQLWRLSAAWTCCSPTPAGRPRLPSMNSMSAWAEAIDLSFMSHVRLISAALPSLRSLIPRCPDRHLHLHQAAHPQPGALQQHPCGHSWADQNPSPGTGARRHPLQFHPPLLDNTERVEQLMGPGLPQGHHCSQEIAVKTNKAPWAGWLPRKNLPGQQLSCSPRRLPTSPV